MDRLTAFIALYLAGPILAPVRPLPLGFSRSGAPIYPVRGGDGSVLDLTTATVAELTAERTRLLDLLTAGTASDDDMTRAGEVADAIATRNAAVQRTTEMRQRLLGATPTPGAQPQAQTVRTSQPGAEPAGGTPQGGSLNAEPEQRVSYGMEFARSEAVRSLAAANGHGNTRATVGADREVRALFATTNYPSNATRVPELIVPNRDVPLQVLDLVDRRPMASGTVEWVQEDTAPISAAEVAEGAVKPESTWALSLITSVAATVAHFVNITRQTLQDEAQLQGYVEGRLTYGLMRRLNAQIISGNGTAPNLRGIQNTAGRGVYTAPAGEANIISVRKAKTVAQLSEYEPDSLVINPADWERIELSTDAQGSFRIAQPQGGLTPRLWGMNVVVTTAVLGGSPDPDGAGALVAVAGRFIVGAFREGATLWERMGVELFITDSHASNFTSNILTLLAELRAVLSVWRPKAFVDGTFATP